MKAALTDAVKAALARINETAETIGADVNGWRVGAAAGDRAFFHGDWALRAVGAKLGIYGNDQAEAVYPFAKNDGSGLPLNGSTHAYAVTFAPDSLPPVNAFWSITMYDGRTQFLVANPIDRYLINAPMLPDLKKNPDGSLTIYIQKDSPGKDKESNWLPAPDGPIFIVMRLYWPKIEPPSILPLGHGTWKPPAIVNVDNLRALDKPRFGDKSLENLVRTDDRYGGDGPFHGPRGWGYWNHLEYPRPIQDPNLWPDTQSTYFVGQLELPAGARLTLHGAYPRARYFQLALYRFENNTFVSVGGVSGADIEPDAGATNPFRVGADRQTEARSFSAHIVAADPPSDPAKRENYTLYAGAKGGVVQAVLREYLSDIFIDGAGWGPSDAPAIGRGLPTYEATLADGTRLTQAEVAARVARPMAGATPPPITATQWEELVHAKDNDPALDPATAPARKDPKWEKFWTLKYTILGAFKTPEEQARIPYEGAMEGGGDPSTQYLVTFLSRKFGPVYVMRGKMPKFPDTFSGRRARSQDHAGLPDCLLVARQLRGAAIRAHRRRDRRHASPARQGRQLYDRGQPPGRPAEERHARKRRRLGRMESEGRRRRQPGEPDRLRHADAAHHGRQSGLGAES